VVSEDLEGQARENRDNGGRGRLAQACKIKWSRVIGSRLVRAGSVCFWRMTAATQTKDREIERGRERVRARVSRWKRRRGEEIVLMYRLLLSFTNSC
jgi:hypothetical protein